jgi:hypothetical protein
MALAPAEEGKGCWKNGIPEKKRCKGILAAKVKQIDLR